MDKIKYAGNRVDTELRRLEYTLNPMNLQRMF